MASFTLEEICACTSGKLVAGGSRQRVSGVSTDTRRVRRNQVFVAIKGENFDGHDFLAQAVSQGAVALVISRSTVPVPRGAGVILVDDTVKALGRIARLHRQRFNIPLIAITGSAGKTSTKELVAAVLRRKYTVLFNKGTENNHIGVPMTLLRLTRRHEAAVIEMGTNHPGEIAWLAENAAPTMAVFTNIGASHLEGLVSLDGVFAEKISLLKFLPDDGYVVVNADDPYWAKLLKMRLPQKVIAYGIEARADVKATDVKVAKAAIHFKTEDGGDFMVKSPSRGAVLNALAALACGRLLGVPQRSVQDALKRAKPARGRQCVSRVRGVTIIDDTYNANPLSYTNALRTLGMLAGGGRAVLVAADMLELGASSQELHREVGIAAAACVNTLFTFGDQARLIGVAAKSRKPALDMRHFSDKGVLAAELSRYLRPGDVLLVKGSRGMRMEKVVQDITGSLKG